MPEPITIHFLGTGGTAPFKKRKMPCIAVKFLDKLIIMDIGEGCQYSLLTEKFHPKRSKVIILISHFHADHTTGLPGFLNSLKLMNKTDPIIVIGPRGLSTFLSHVEKAFQLEDKPYELFLKEIQTEKTDTLIQAYEDKEIKILCFRTIHPNTSSLGFILMEKESHKTLAIRNREEFMKLSYNQKRRFLCQDSSFVVIRPPRSIVYTGDTRPIYFLKDLVPTPPDLIIHDATFIGDAHYEEALKTGHSSIEEALDIASLLRASTLALVHISPRYELDTVINAILKSIRGKIEKGLPEKFLPNIIIPCDGDIVTIR
ncbi:MAG: MBL fold metallo-hydrolase [Candidatus Njordarchaeales archaeon]